MPAEWQRRQRVFLGSQEQVLEQAIPEQLGVHFAAVEAYQ